MIRDTRPKRTLHRRQEQRLKAVILDWAGTIVDYGSTAPARAFCQLFSEYQLPISNEEARGPMGLNKREHIRSILNIASVNQRWKEKYGRQPTEMEIETMHQDFVDILKQQVARNTEIIPGTLQAVASFRRRSLKIGSTSGYDRDIMSIIMPIAIRSGVKIDDLVCATDVPRGRPEPWMALRCAMDLQVYPMSSIVKIGDTLPDIAEGLNAGMWTIGIAKTGNELGLCEEEIQQLPSQQLQRKLEAIHDRMYRAGAHFVVDGISDVPSVLEEIERYLAQGVAPND